MERLTPPPHPDGFQPGSQSGVPPRARKEAACQRAIVEPRPAHENREFAASVNPAHGGRGVPRVLGCRVLVHRINDVDQVMRDAAPGFERHFVCTDVESSIDGRRVAVDDLAVVALGQRERQRAFAGRRRTEYRNEQRPGHYVTAISTYTMNARRRMRRPSCWVSVTAWAQGLKARRF